MVGMTRSSSRFPAVSHPSVSVFRRFCGPKTLGRQNLLFLAQNWQRTYHKVGTARPSKAIHTANYAEDACPYSHRVTDNRHTECAERPWWPFGSRRARIACGGSPHRFCTKPAVVRARLCHVDDDASPNPARLNCCGSLGAALPSFHNSLAGRRGYHYHLGMDVLELQ
jgi:hypothetical protein